MAEVEDPSLQAWIEEQEAEYRESQSKLARAEPVTVETCEAFETTDEGVITEEITAPIDMVLEVFKTWLYVEEDYAITAPMCAVIANFCPGDPDIIGIVGPSGSCKTEFIRSLGESETDYVYPVSTITEKTLVSGYDESKDLAPRLDGRLLTIKDLTSLLSKKEDSRAQIFADFREITDGYIKKEFGNGVIKEYRGLHSSILFASTNAIERYYSMYSSLGQRMIFIRPRSDPTEARRRAKENRGLEDVMRNEIHQTVETFVRGMSAIVEETGLLSTPEWFDEEMGELYDLLAIARTTIHHDFRGDIDEIPEPEFPTRIAKTVSRLCEVHCLIYGRDELNEDDLKFGTRIISDNIPTQRLQVLKVLNDDWMISSRVSSLARLPTNPTKRILDELQALGLIDRLPRGQSDIGDYSDNRSDSYRISSKYKAAIAKLAVVI